MAENRLGLLYSAASILAQTPNKTYEILRSYYLMRCPELKSSIITSNISINKERCSSCCLEWHRNAKCQVKTVKLSRRQKKRMKSKKNSTSLKSKQVEKICSLCGHASAVHVVKLDKKINRENTIVNENIIEKKPAITRKQETKIKPLNVYANIKEVFSIRNENNKVKSDPAPVKIKNNKKKKDRFAGLCQKAVLDAVKRKKEVEKKDKLNLFLKPSL